MLYMMNTGQRLIQLTPINYYAIIVEYKPYMMRRRNIMKKIFFVLALTLILVGCGDDNNNQQDETTTQTTTQAETTTSEETTTQVPAVNTLVMTDPNNEYPNNQFVFYFDGDTLTKVEYIIVFDNIDDAILGQTLYNSYADQYESIVLDNLTLTVTYGPEPMSQYQGFTKAGLQANQESQGLVVK